MIRKLLMLAVTAVAVFAFSAVSASAVVVENPGMYEIEGENTLELSSEAPEGTQVGDLECENNWEANIDESGAIEVHDINLDEHGTSSAQCDDVDDCPDFHWQGQIFEDYFNPANQTNHEFGLTQSFCLVNAGIPGVVGPSSATCEIDDSEVHCEHVFIHIPQIEVELHGELTIHGDLGLMHEEA
jgi:opacity protein-like surface antigen